MGMNDANRQLRAAGAKSSKDSGSIDMCEKHSAAAQATVQRKEGSDQVCQQRKPPRHDALSARRATAGPYMHHPDERPPRASSSASHLRKTPSMIHYDDWHRLQAPQNGTPEAMHEPPGHTFEHDDVDVDLALGVA